MTEKSYEEYTLFSKTLAERGLKTPWDQFVAIGSIVGGFYYLTKQLRIANSIKTLVQNNQPTHRLPLLTHKIIKENHVSLIRKYQTRGIIGGFGIPLLLISWRLSQ